MEQTNETNNTSAIDVSGAEDSKFELTPDQQKWFDEKVREATRKASERAEKRVEERAAAKLKEIEEAERLKNMTESEKRDEEIRQYKAKIADFEQRELKNQFKVELAAAGLPQECADFIPARNAEEAKEAISFFKSFKDGIVSAYEKRIKELESQLKSAQMRTSAPKVPRIGDKASPQFEDIYNKIKKQ